MGIILLGAHDTLDSEGEVLSCEEIWGNRDIAPLSFSHGTRWRRVVRFASRQFDIRRKSLRLILGVTLN